MKKNYYINYRTQDGTHPKKSIYVGHNKRYAVQTAKQLADSVTHCGTETTWAVFDENTNIVEAGIICFTQDGRTRRYTL